MRRRMFERAVSQVSNPASSCFCYAPRFGEARCQLGGVRAPQIFAYGAQRLRRKVAGSGVSNWRGVLLPLLLLLLWRREQRWL